jgi:hypothetical protein
MIGVAVHPNEREAAAEFFELFKTPWEFYRTGARYDVVLCTSDNFRREMSPLVFFFDGRATPYDAEQKRAVNSRPGGLLVSNGGKRLPVYGGMATFPNSPNALLREEATQEPAAIVGRCEHATAVRVGYNLFAEVRFLLTTGQSSSHAGIPTLEEHIGWLRDWITLAGLPVVEIPPVPDGHNFTACLTHDIDHPSLRNHWCDHTMFGFLYRSTVGTWRNVCRGRKPVSSVWKNGKAACLLPFVHLGLAKDFWGHFDRYLEVEAGHGSTFFVIPRKDYPGRTMDGPGPSMRACRYDVEQLLPQLNRIVSAGGEVGVHGLDAWLDVEAGRQERERVSRALGVTELGVRMHWLFFDENSPAMLDRSGFTYDTTVGYRETVGYRAGTTQAYRPPGVSRLLELPLHVMDTALFYPSYLNLSEPEAERLVWRLLDDVDRFGGALTINWHDRSIAPERLWDNFYLKLLRELKNRGAWLPTAGQAVAWFKKRRAATLESVRIESGTVRVSGRMNTPDSSLPGLKIRVHKPRGRSLIEALAARKPAELVDVRFDSPAEFSISI